MLVINGDFDENPFARVRVFARFLVLFARHLMYFCHLMNFARFLMHFARHLMHFARQFMSIARHILLMISKKVEILIFRSKLYYEIDCDYYINNCSIYNDKMIPLRI